MSTSGSSSSNFSLMSADPEDSYPRDDDDEAALKKLIMNNHEEESLPQSIVRALQRTAADMQDEELSGIMEEKIKQYVLSKEVKKAEHCILDTEIDEKLSNEIHEENGTGRATNEEKLVAKCEEEIQVYVKQQEQLDSSDSSKGSNNQQNDTTINPPSPVGTANSSQPESQPTRPLTREQLAAASLPNLPLEIGDHVYQWRSFVGVPGIFQHHGIVMDIGRDENGEMELKIADFSCILRSSLTAINNDAYIKEKDQKSVDILTGTEDENNRCSIRSPHGVLRVYKSGAKDPKWRKVHYRASVWKTSLWRSGTCTCVESDPPAKVLARAYFLLEHPELLPSYHIFNSNCECVAVWCKTGKWCTLQASSVLSLTAAGQLKSTATIAAYAASQQVTVQAPAAGIWGWMGYTTTSQVSLISTQPHLIPLLAAYGVVTAGAPTFVLWRAQHFWEHTSERLNDKFWQYACKDPDMFANSMMFWSERHAAFEHSR